MSISPADAESALRDVRNTDSRVRGTIAYHRVSPHLILWGAVWIVGYTSNGLLPPAWRGLAWLPLIALGALGSVILGMQVDRRAEKGGRPGETLSMIGGAITIAFFFFATYSIFRPHDALPQLALPALVTGLIYAVVGMLRMPRMLVIGAAMIVLTFVGFLISAQYLAFWIAAVGGGGLIVSGLWLRSA
jgi:hypothetical protein